MTSENKANKYKAIYKRIKRRVRYDWHKKISYKNEIDVIAKLKILVKIGKKYRCLLFKRVSKLPRKLALSYKNYYSNAEIYK
ncbi:hypothetical protein [Brachyspira murdochii]|uniref:Uncharacterized protein n=1 Tax=Brachyspira murdochii (strain ATCC 51284 / DSM 12563 / 56-150) TaxID=526224 RepID=D5UAS0_BRAM5|nr:hypothetical protein [Brachyspira murdochii]ADG71793.1 hypothetical protein Bmur_1708 [Brachyspira murdochii DSM 12563]